MRTARPSDAWTPLHYLASVGAGGLSVTFFMWLMHWLPHPGRTVPTFEDIAGAWAGGEVMVRGTILVAMAAIAGLVALNLSLLVWNLRAHARWAATEGAAKFVTTNAQSQLMAQPLALAMAVNGAFVAGLVFVPGLWSVIEYLFPLAIVAFLAIAVLAFRVYGGFVGRVLGDGGFACAANNSFGQMLPAFAFAMIGVGLAAPAALSANASVVGLSLVLSTFFLVTALVIGVLALVMGLRAMLENGAAPETAPTLMIVLPLATILGILMLRQDHALGTLGAHSEATGSFMFLTQLVALQVLFAMLGLTVLARQGYARVFLFGDRHSAGSWALVCPGVAFAVLVQFWVNKGLVGAGLIAKFGVVYWSLTALAIAAQVAMLWLVWHLYRRQFVAPRTPEAVPAE
jgi:hypothetical protein